MEKLSKGAMILTNKERARQASKQTDKSDDRKILGRAAIIIQEDDISDNIL